MGASAYRTVECHKCGDADVFDTWPEEAGEDTLDQLIRAEGWTYRDGRDYCPECAS